MTVISNLYDWKLQEASSLYASAHNSLQSHFNLLVIVLSLQEHHSPASGGLPADFLT